MTVPDKSQAYKRVGSVQPHPNGIQPTGGKAETERLRARSSSTPPSPERCPTCSAPVVRTKGYDNGLIGASKIASADSFAYIPPAPPSSPETRGTIKATAVPGTLPDRAPFVWDEPPAELTEALIAHERLCMVDLRRAFASDDPAREIAPITKSIFDSRSALISIYDRQREEIEDEKAISKRQGKAIAELCTEVERLKASQLTPEMARYALAEYGAVGEQIPLSEYSPEVWKATQLALRSLSQRND